MLNVHHVSVHDTLVIQHFLNELLDTIIGHIAAFTQVNLSENHTNYYTRIKSYIQ